jgi:hypothetical protein
VEHETDEALGTSSWIHTNGRQYPAAVDLSRYNRAENLVLEDTTPGAYFSCDGGVTNTGAGHQDHQLRSGADFEEPADHALQLRADDTGSECNGLTGEAESNDTEDGGGG